MEPNRRGHFTVRLCVVVSQIAITLHRRQFIHMIVNEGSVSVPERTFCLDNKDSPAQRHLTPFSAV